MVRKDGAFDLNRCTIRQLVQLSGIPVENARKLVRFRARQRKNAHRMARERKARMERCRSLHKKLAEEGLEAETTMHLEEKHIKRKNSEDKGNVPDRSLRFKSGKQKGIGLWWSMKNKNQRVDLEKSSSEVSPRARPGTDRILICCDEHDWNSEGKTSLRCQRLGTLADPVVISVGIKTPEEGDNSDPELDHSNDCNELVQSTIENQQNPMQPLGEESSFPTQLTSEQIFYQESQQLMHHASPDCGALQTSMKEEDLRPQMPEGGPTLAEGFHTNRCKICGALEKCWTKLQRRVFTPNHPAAELYQRQLILTEMGRRSRWRRRRESRQRRESRMTRNVEAAIERVAQRSLRQQCIIL